MTAPRSSLAAPSPHRRAVGFVARPPQERHRAKQRAYYAANRERVLAHQHAWREANQGKIHAYAKAYYAAAA